MSIENIDKLLTSIDFLEENENELREIDIRGTMLANDRLARSHIFAQKSQNNSDCSICWEDIDSVGLSGIKDPSVTICGHLFHLSCLSMHVKKSGKKTCPACRTSFE